MATKGYTPGNECDQLKKDLAAKEAQLRKAFEDRDKAFEINDKATLTLMINLITQLQGEKATMEARKRELNCDPAGKVTFDNQSVIAACSVIKKSREALQLL